MRRLIVGATAALLIAGCGADSKTVSTSQPASSSQPASTSAPAPGASTASPGPSTASPDGSTALDNPAVRETFVRQLQGGLHNISSVQAGRIADCAIAQFKADGYHTSGAIPQDRAVQVGKECATKIIRRK